MPSPLATITPPDALLLSQAAITESFSARRERVFARPEIFRIIASNQQAWRVESKPSEKRLQQRIARGELIAAESDGSLSILAALLEHTPLKQFELPFPSRPATRYVWGDAGTLEIVQSIDAAAYFSHYTAMQFHGLTEQIPKSVYVNVEQAASSGGGQLTQEGIDRSFRKRCRTTNSRIELNGRTIYRLNGANTGRLGVIELETDNGRTPLRLTNIERTLIDATVRPVYAGGVSEVAKAFRAAAGRVSVNKLVAFLRKLSFTYPYHQSIGFYLEQAGVYKASQIDLLRKFEIEFDFYLTYEMTEPDYDERWRLFIPKGFQ